MYRLFCFKLNNCIIQKNNILLIAVVEFSEKLKTIYIIYYLLYICMYNLQTLDRKRAKHANTTKNKLYLKQREKHNV